MIRIHLHAGACTYHPHMHQATPTSAILVSVCIWQITIECVALLPAINVVKYRV